MKKPNNEFSGNLDFRMGDDVVDTHDCSGRISARQHAKHLVGMYGKTIEIYSEDGTFLDEVENQW